MTFAESPAAKARRIDGLKAKRAEAEIVEKVAEALWWHRWAHIGFTGSWAQFCKSNRDVAIIYRENARIAIKAYRKAMQ